MNFAHPYLLAMLLALPLIWWLIRLMPPAPKLVVFPALKLFQNIAAHRSVAARASVWLLLLRLVLVSLVIVALAEPVLPPTFNDKSSGKWGNELPLLIVIDNDWASARAFELRLEKMRVLVAEAARHNRQIYVLPTAADADRDSVQIMGPFVGQNAKAMIERIVPHPWPANWQNIAELIKTDKTLPPEQSGVAAEKSMGTDVFAHGAGAITAAEPAQNQSSETQPALPARLEAVYLNSGLGGADMENMRKALSRFGEVKLFSDAEQTPIYLLSAPKMSDDKWQMVLYRAMPNGPDLVSVAALSKEGKILAQFPARFPAGTVRSELEVALSRDVRNAVARFEVEGAATAAGTILLDTAAHRASVGIVMSGYEENQSLLDEHYYLKRAMQPYMDVQSGTVVELLKQKPSALFLTDENILDAKQMAALSKWVREGGVLVRFAGENLTAAESAPQFVSAEAEGAAERAAERANPPENDNQKKDEESSGPAARLLPVRLSAGNRDLGGIFSWSDPQKLKAFSEYSPFYGLSIAEDIVVNRQLLAEPDIDITSKSWASLTDGTPLVSGIYSGRGAIVLFHVPALPGWSNLPLSGMFIEMLQRLVELAGKAGNGGPSVYKKGGMPLQILDAFGNLKSPPDAVLPMDDLAHPMPSPLHPPGLYGNSQQTFAFNLGAALPPPVPFTLKAEPLTAGKSSLDLTAILLCMAFGLFLIDFFISLRSRGLGFAAILFCLGVLFPLQNVSAGVSEKLGIERTGRTFLAYVITGDKKQDKISESGLNALAEILDHRSAAENIGVVGIDPASDELAFYPLIYWLLNPEQVLSEQAAQNLNAYMHNGGLIVIDTGSAASGILSGNALPALRGLNLPRLNLIPETHVLRKSFYLLRDFPGRYAGNELWLEAAPSQANDGVSSVIVGNNGWAEAWAVDADGKPLYPCVPGGEAQRETAYRFGVNLVMYALTGNYKADQLHAKALLERQGK